MNRTKNTIINIATSFGGNIVVLLASFVSRTIFVQNLSKEYLGINGLFANILSVLSLLELGVGTAIIYSLYKPIADNDLPKVNALMNFYRKAYITIGCIIMIIGVAITPFLGLFFKDTPDVSLLKIYFLLYVINTVISYFYTYKRSLIIANQKGYISTIYNDIFFVLRNISQIIVLILTGSFLLYLIIQIICTFLENFSISKKADKMYPFLRKSNSVVLDKATSKEIQKNTLAMIGHRIGEVVINGTDNILLSKYIGIVEVGLYSNYLLIINSINKIYNLIFTASTASIGNLGATESKEKMKFIFNCLNLVGFWISAVSSICLFNLINPFIDFWLGKGYLLSTEVVFFIIINYYITCMRRGVLTFRDALGLYWYDRYKPLFESIINLLVSIILVIKLGMVGALIGTTFSTVVTCLWVEPYILYKYGFATSVSPYFYKFGYYTAIMFVAGTATWLICNEITGSSFVIFGLKMVACFFIPNLFFLILFWRTKEFKYLFSITTSLIKRRKKIVESV
jgi:O-antigen/teichoic acid export membrane protein